MIIGASVQLIYLGILGPGGNLPQDPTLAALVSTAIVLKSGMPVETAFAIAVPVGLLGAQILNLIRLINTTWIHMADKYAENGKHKRDLPRGAGLSFFGKDSHHGDTGSVGRILWVGLY